MATTCPMTVKSIKKEPRCDNAVVGLLLITMGYVRSSLANQRAGLGGWYRMGSQRPHEPAPEWASKRCTHNRYYGASGKTSVLLLVGQRQRDDSLRMDGSWLSRDHPTRRFSR